MDSRPLSVVYVANIFSQFYQLSSDFVYDVFDMQIKMLNVLKFYQSFILLLVDLEALLESHLY